MNKIVIGCDHGGLELKNEIIKHLNAKNIETCDVGTYTSDSCNYPDYASALCKKIQCGEFERGILVCGTGIGMSMAANKHKGIRAACCSDTFSARMTRMHNDANVLFHQGRERLHHCIATRMISRNATNVIKLLGSAFVMSATQASRAGAT